jgi:RimJ/RimL family protein N-acetyltransferase
VRYVEASLDLWSTGRKAVFAIVDADDPDRLLGVISLTIAGRCGNAAYWVVPAARGRGVARRALTLLTDWAFSSVLLGILLLEIHETNTASVHVALAAGFHRSGHIDVPSPGGPGGALLYSRLVTDPAPGDRPAAP